MRCTHSRFDLDEEASALFDEIDAALAGGEGSEFKQVCQRACHFKQALADAARQMDLDVSGAASEVSSLRGVEDSDIDADYHSCRDSQEETESESEYFNCRSPGSSSRASVRSMRSTRSFVSARSSSTNRTE